jgi:hypothetical protein
LLFIQQPGNTHGIYRNGQIKPTDLLALSSGRPFASLLMLTQMDGCGIATEGAIDGRSFDGRSCEMKILTKTDPKSWRRKGCAIDRKNF